VRTPNFLKAHLVRQPRTNEFSKARTLARNDTELGAKINGALKSRREKT
jgi:hypothetical protein